MPNSSNWKAIEIPAMDGSSYELVVTGQVEVAATNLEPVLKPAAPQGTNPKILLLDLTIEAHGDAGAAVVVTKVARYAGEVAKGQYVQVTVDGNTVDVEVVESVA